MNRWFRNLSVRYKLLALLCAVSTVALVLAVAALLTYDTYSTQRALERHLETLGLVVGSNCLASLEFEDRDTAESILQSLRKESSIDAARLYGTDRQPFATYIRDEYAGVDCPLEAALSGIVSSDDEIRLLTPVSDIDGTTGYLFLTANKLEWKHEVRTKLMIAIAILVAGLAVATVLAYWLQDFVSRPIVTLAAAARLVESNHDYTIRVAYNGNDEVGHLYVAFNDMLARIGKHEQSLREAQEVLEQRVTDRTAELSQTNVELHQEVRQHERAQRELEDTQKKLVEAARLAGMADIAAGVLHNVGNVLNSVNVRITVMLERIETALNESEDLVACSDLLQQNAGQLSHYLSKDERGRHAPEFLQSATSQMHSQWGGMSADVLQLRDFFAHIRQIVTSHQSMAKVSGTHSRLLLSELFDEALTLNDASLAKHQIKVEKSFVDDPPINSDRHRILQILVNLVSNAKHATTAHPEGARVITLSITAPSPDSVVATVTDNGVGIATEDMPSIFQSGFTTKRNGHGFGLHTSAIAAQELGGTLEARSNGLGKGAEFILTLPTVAPNKIEKLGSVSKHM